MMELYPRILKNKKVIENSLRLKTYPDEEVCLKADLAEIEFTRARFGILTRKRILLFKS